MNAYFADAYSKRLERHAKAEESKRLEAEHQQGKEDQEKQDWTPQSEQVGRDGAEEAKQAHALLRRGEERRRREEAFPSTLDPSGTGADLSRPCQEAGRETRTSRREELPRREEASRRDEPSRREEPSRRDEPPRREELARREEHPRREEPARREEAARRDEPNRREEPRREELSRREDLLARRKGITSDADPAGGRTTRHRSRSPPERANARGSERGMGGWPDRGAEHPTGRGSQDEPQRWQASNRARDEAGDDDRRKAAQHHHRQVAPSPHDDRRREDERRRREDEEDRRRRDEERRKQEEEDRRRREEERRKQEEEDRRRREEERRRQEAESTRRWEAERSKREEEKSRVEEERRKHEEAVQRRRDEKRKIEEAERQLLEEQRRKEREIERKEQEERKLEEDKRREELEKKRREEWRKHEETMKAKAEEDKKRTEEEAAKRRGEEAKVLRQQQATLSVLRLLQKLSNANPENFDTLKAELEQALKTELPETGSQQELLKAEADRVLEYAKQYVEQVREQQQKWEEMRLQQLQKMEEQERTARALVEELVQLVTLAEAASEFVHYTAAPLAGDHELENAKVLLIGREVEQAGKTAMAACSSCADFLVQRRPEIDEAEGIRAEVQNQVSALQTRIQAATQQATEALQRARESTERIAREVASAARADQQAALFKKYDEDGDGILNRQEIRRYSREEFGFDLPAENLDRICRQLFQDDRDGLEFSDLQVLKTAVGIAREEERSRVKRAARLEKERQDKEDAEKRQALVEEKLEMLATESAQLMSEMNDLESKIRGAEADAETLANEAGQLEVEDLKSKAASVDASAESVKSALIVVQKQIQGLTNEVAEMPELVDPMRQELTSLSSKADMQSLRLLKAQGTAANARQLAFHKAFAEYDALRLEVATKLRVCIEAKGGKVDDLFGAIAGDRSEVTLEDVSLFLERQQCEVEAEKLEALFPRPEEAGAPAPEAGAPEAEAGAPAAPAAGAEGGEAGAAAGAPGRARGAPVSREDLARVLRIFYKVVKEIVLSDDLLIERSGQIRRMDVGEVMEVYQGPVLDPSVGVCRIHGRAMRDGVVGWVTVAGKQGVTFLLPGGNVFKVMKPTFLSEDMKDLEGERFLRMLHEGEILEVLDWTRTSRSALGVTRIKAKVLGDGSIGWATTVDNDGVVYLEAA